MYQELRFEWMIEFYFPNIVHIFLHNFSLDVGFMYLSSTKGQSASLQSSMMTRFTLAVFNWKEVLVVFVVAFFKPFLAVYTWPVLHWEAHYYLTLVIEYGRVCTLWHPPPNCNLMPSNGMQERVVPKQKLRTQIAVLNLRRPELSALLAQLWSHP